MCNLSCQHLPPNVAIYKQPSSRSDVICSLPLEHNPETGPKFEKSSIIYSEGLRVTIILTEFQICLFNNNSHLRYILNITRWRQFRLKPSCSLQIHSLNLHFQKIKKNCDWFTRPFNHILVTVSDIQYMICHISYIRYMPI